MCDSGTRVLRAITGATPVPLSKQELLMQGPDPRVESNDGSAAGTSVLVSWSGGKDSCVALHEIQNARTHRVAALLTTLTRDFDRISMHGVRRELLERQAAALGLTLHQIFISKNATNEEYELKMGQTFAHYREQGIDSV